MCIFPWPDKLVFCHLGLISDPLIVSKFHNHTHDPKGQEHKFYTIVKVKETFYRRHTVVVKSNMFFKGHISWARLASLCHLVFISDPIIRSTNSVSMHELNGDMYYFKSRIYLARISIRDSSSKKEVPIVQLVIITARFSCPTWIYVNILVLWIRL